MMNTFLAFGMPGPSELIFIFLIVLLLFGAKRLPELARGLGKSIKEFKRATNFIYFLKTSLYIFKKGLSKKKFNQENGIQLSVAMWIMESQ